MENSKQYLEDSDQSESPRKHGPESVQNITSPDTTGDPSSEKANIHSDGNNDNTTPPAPDGGLEAWLVAFGSFSMFFCCLGFANSFGPLADYFLSHQLLGHSPDEVAWIGSLSAFLQFFAAVFGGPLFDKYGARVSTLPNYPLTHNPNSCSNPVSRLYSPRPYYM